MPELARARAWLLTNEIVISSGEAARELTSELRSTLTAELTRRAVRAEVRHRVIVSVTLTRLTSEQRGSSIKTSAAISLALRRGDDHVLFAELRGRSSVEESTKNLAPLRKRALEGALALAFAQLPAAVER